MRKILKILVVNITLLIGFTGICQEESKAVNVDDKKNQTSKKISKADKAFENLEYVNAIKKYLNSISDNEPTPLVLARMADSYFSIADYKNSAYWYGKLKKTNSEEMNADRKHKYAISLKSIKNYASSDKAMESLNTIDEDDYRGELFVNEKNYLNDIENRSGQFEIRNLEFNSKLYDFAPSFYGDDILFSSNRKKSKKVKNIHTWNNQAFLEIYRLNTITEEKPVLMPESINTDYHESTSISTKDGNTIYFTRNNFTNKVLKRDNKGVNLLKIYRAKRKDKSDKWNVEELPFNSDQYSVAHPALNPDETELYFSSDMPGSKGASDLYKVAIQGDGFGEVESLGDAINTEARETFPFISYDNVLYFASDGHLGLGGLDIFEVKLNQADNIESIYNLGEPINSPKDDVTFIVNEDGEGYLASNRDGGKGEDDIYAFTVLEKACLQTVTGIVTEAKSKNVLPNSIVVVYDSKGRQINKTLADEHGAFTFDLSCNNSYTFKGNYQDYDPDEKRITVAEGDPVNVPLVLKSIENTLADSIAKNVIEGPKIGDDLAKFLKLNPIYFDLDKSFIRLDAEIELQKIIVLMQLYPKLKIDVRSHTDSRNTHIYNQALSMRRANSTMKYIIKNGIESSRITGQGYGETQLTNRCADNVKCSKAEHQLNRRSEFIVVAN